MSARKYYGRLAAAFGGPRWGWLALATGIVLADQGAKAWITSWLPYGASAAAAPFVNLVHLLNEGAAFSLFADAGGEQRYFLTVVALVVSAGLVFLLLRGEDTGRTALGYSLILGGAMGNAVDRILRGAVVDYLDLYVGSLHSMLSTLAYSPCEPYGKRVKWRSLSH